MTETVPESSDGPVLRALVLGHLSTVGDIEVMGWVTGELARLGVPFDVSAYSLKLQLLNPDWVNGRKVDPYRYSHLVVVCGPFTPGTYQHHIDLFGRFAHCTWVGVNLTMVAPLERFNPFDVLLERDSHRQTRPDLSFLRTFDRVPVVGVCFVRTQREYGANQLQELSSRRLRALAKRHGAAMLELDTVWPASENRYGLGSPAEFESLCARVDVLLTNRLHGMVLGLKSGVPVIALDPIRGGGKVLRQAQAIGWQEAFPADAVSDEELSAAFARCLGPDARSRVQACTKVAHETLAGAEAEFAAALRSTPGPRDLPSERALRWRRTGRLIYERFKEYRIRPKTK